MKLSAEAMRKRYAVTSVRLVMKSPRVFILGLIFVVLSISAGIALAVVATGQVGAQMGNGSAPACISYYTGAVRMGLPGQQLNCSQGEYLVEINVGSPASNLTYAVRTVEDDVSSSAYVGAFRTVDCLEGETAISGGSRLLADGVYISSSTFEGGTDGPEGSPPTGWMSGFVYSSSSPTPGRVVETWVLCVS